jgi:hypothetical protein
MTTPRIPDSWMHLRPGEMMHSKQPHHKLVAISKVMKALGVTVRLDPSPTGYFVVCVKRKAAA